jgi:hypothetical protein
MLTCSFCAFYECIDAADRVVVINGQSACLPHAKLLYDDRGGDWLVALSQIGRDK